MHWSSPAVNGSAIGSASGGIVTSITYRYTESVPFDPEAVREYSTLPENPSPVPQQQSAVPTDPDPLKFMVSLTKRTSAARRQEKNGATANTSQADKDRI